MKISKKNKKIIKGVAVGSAVAVGLGLLYKSVNKGATATTGKTVTAGGPVIGTVKPYRPVMETAPANMGCFTPLPASTSPSTFTPQGGGLINTLANNPFINPMAIIPKIGGLFRR